MLSRRHFLSAASLIALAVPNAAYAWVLGTAMCDNSPMWLEKAA
jgi:hypothetical protein